jgi:hypothetical protein
MRTFTIFTAPFFVAAIAGITGCAVDVQNPTPGQDPSAAAEQSVESTASAPAARSAHLVAPESAPKGASEAANAEGSPPKGEAFERPVLDQDGKEVKPLTKEEAMKLIAAQGSGSSETSLGLSGNEKTDATVYYHCNAWIYPGDVVFCGTVFFGWSNIFVENCSPAWGIFMREDGNYYAIQPMINPWTCSVITYSGWFWGANLAFQNFGSTPLYVTH